MAGRAARSVPRPPLRLRPPYRPGDARAAPYPRFPRRLLEKVPSAVHRDLLHRIRRDFKRRLHDPVRTAEDAYLDTVCVLESWCFEIDRAERAIAAATRSREHAPAWQMVWWCPSLDPPFRNLGWLEEYYRRWEPELRAVAGCCGVRDDELRALRNWFLTCARIHLRRRGRLQRFRDAVRRALALEPEIVRLASAGRAAPAMLVLRRKSGKLSRHRVPRVTTATYSAVWRNLEAFRTVEREAPAYLPLLLAACAAHRFEPASPQNALRDLKRFALDQGIGRLGWRLCSGGLPAAVRELVAFFWSASEFSTIACALRGLARAGFFAARFDDRFVLRLLRVAFRHLRGQTLGPFGAEDFPFRPLVVALREGARRLERDEPQAFWQEAEAVLGWCLRELDRSRAARLLARIDGWAPLVKREGIARRRRAALGVLGEGGWASAIGLGAIGALSIRALTDPAALWDEAERARNCIGDEFYVQGCRSGRYRVFSASGPQGRVTLLIERGADEWSLNAARGFANEPAPPEMFEAGRELARLYAMAERAAIERGVPLLELSPPASAAPAAETAPCEDDPGEPRF